MRPRLHVGVTVWPARSDFFFFLRNWVAAREPREEYRKLSLPPVYLAIVTKVEYSSLWLFRIILYRRIARYIEMEIVSILREADGHYRDIIFYLPDDGYWAELFHVIRRRAKGAFKILNVQHGQPVLSAKSKLFRRLANRLSVLVSGYPNFGYGFGAGTLDGYIVMSEHERKFVVENFGTPAYVAPYFIRGDFFAAAEAVTPPALAGRKMRVLFAISPVFGKKSNLFGARDRAEHIFYEDIAACLRGISELGLCEIFFRFHPGQDRESAERQFRQAGLSEIAKIDDNFSVVDSLAFCDFVIAYGSTVLFEAALLGKVPVNFVPKNYPPKWELTFRSEVLELARNPDGNIEIRTSRGGLDALFTASLVAEYSLPRQNLNGSEPLEWLI
jgi:hypothetical protein